MNVAVWLWSFWIYSFLGYLLEKIYAAFTRSQQQVRKGFFLLPMCPVYGLGVVSVLALPDWMTNRFWPMAFWGGLTATAVEYIVHFCYDSLLDVQFWDYTQVWGNLKGRVCLPFSILWGILLAIALPICQNLLRPILIAIPGWMTYCFFLVFIADAMISIRLLKQSGDPAILALS